MPLDETVLGALIKTKRLAALGAAGVDNAAMTEDCNAIAAAVVEHILAVAIVTIPPGVPVATAGSPSAQVGATTAPAVGAIT